jgi:hypothetical protein
MALFIFFVLFFIVSIVCCKESNKTFIQTQGDSASAIRRTNARLEFAKTVNFYKSGDSLDEAIKKSTQFLISEGYDAPCIQKDKYCAREGPGGSRELYVSDLLSCDSRLVQHKRTDFNMMCGHRYPTSSEKWQYYVVEEEHYIYSDPFPKTVLEYQRWLEESSDKTRHWISPGKLVHHPYWGTCEMVDLDFHLRNYYVHVIKTGKIAIIPMHDKTLRVL